VALMTDSPRLVMVLTTEADQARAQALAEALLERRLVACVSLQPLLSLYRWKGELQRDAEVQLLLKTNADQLCRLREADGAAQLRHPGMVDLASRGLRRLWRLGLGAAQFRWAAASSRRDTWGRAPSWVTICPAQSAPS
jgi:uncharacterized protein involved in tolerance to divalent cations